MLLRIQLLKPWSTSHGVGGGGSCNAPLPPISQHPQAMGLSSLRSASLITPARLPRLHFVPSGSLLAVSFRPESGQSCVLSRRFYTTQSQGNQWIRPLPGNLIPFAEPIPFILNLLQIREESGNPEKALLGPEPPSR